MKRYKETNILDVKVDSGGKIIIPSHIRKALNMKKGDILTMILKPDETIELKKISTIMKEMQILLSKKGE